MVINRMETNSLEKYEREEKGNQLFECQILDGFVLPTASAFLLTSMKHIL